MGRKLTRTYRETFGGVQLVADLANLDGWAKYVVQRSKNGTGTDWLVTELQREKGGRKQTGRTLLTISGLENYSAEQVAMIVEAIKYGMSAERSALDVGATLANDILGLGRNTDRSQE